ncbi:hypothetical protein OG275_38260 (plasmid) [Streptomyces niveus]|uniref:hypothetical protein n=1 Tax=Streptomyces niveus TaxID=193462 RepID=UPI002E30DF65|nr:hypothetical protein [Streptomyces niveus]
MAAGSYVDKRVNACAGSGGSCPIGVVVKYWYKQGSASRGVGWVYASRNGVRSGALRWHVKTPGGSWKVGAGWKRAVSRGGFVEASWGKDGHTGPKYPRNTRICSEYRGLATKACVTLK